MMLSVKSALIRCHARKKWVAILILLICSFTRLSAQITISGRIVNGTTKQPAAHVNVFLRNTTIGTETDADGKYSLYLKEPGKYDMVVSLVGFDRETRSVVVQGDRKMDDIDLFPKINSLKEVRIKSMSNDERSSYYAIFVKEFIGISDIAKDCKILNPDVIDFSYEDSTRTITASSSDFILIENPDLGYKIKYLLNDFRLRRRPDGVMISLHYEGSSLFEQMKGDVSHILRWQRTRLDVYEGSPMHFLRSAISDALFENGFRVLQYANKPNAQRPADSIISAQIAKFQPGKTKIKGRSDSLEAWKKKQKLPKLYNEMRKYPLNPQEFLKLTDYKNLYYLDCDSDNLYISYNKKHHFSAPALDISSPYNRENTAVYFFTARTLFDKNGIIFHPGDVSFNGYWGKLRIAELLPTDYVPKR